MISRLLAPSHAAGLPRLVLVPQAAIGGVVQHMVFVMERNPDADAAVEPRDLHAWQSLFDASVTPGSQLLAERMKVVGVGVESKSSLDSVD